MTTFSRCIPIAIASFAVVLCSELHAAIIFNNFGLGDAFGNSGLLLQGPDVHTIADVNQAAAFTVGSTGAFLTSAELGINSGGPGPATGPIDVILAADAAGLPGAGLQHSIVNVTTNGNQLISAGFPGTLLLAANTKYWVIADAEGTFDGGWNFNTTGDTGPTAGQTEGGPWSLHSPEQRFAFRVQGRLVPEPASLALIAGGLIGLLAHRSRGGWHSLRLLATCRVRRAELSFDGTRDGASCQMCC